MQQKSLEQSFCEVAVSELMKVKSPEEMSNLLMLMLTTHKQEVTHTVERENRILKRGILIQNKKISEQVAQLNNMEDLRLQNSQHQQEIRQLRDQNTRMYEALQQFVWTQQTTPSKSQYGGGHGGGAGGFGGRYTSAH